ncbi:hypothetical protein ACC795_12335 [Rhizobium ruizarguesonis]
MISTFDLTAAAAKISNEHRSLTKAVSKYAAAYSFALDLESALGALSAVAAIDQLGGEERSVFGQALMVHAATMYCRAAIEDGNGRNKVGVTKNFSDQQMQQHKDVVKFRNKTLAHFDIGAGRYGEAWTDERVVMQIVDGRLRVNFAWSRANYLAQFVEDLMELCTVALERVREVRDDCYKILLKEIKQAPDRVIAEIKKWPFNAEEFFEGLDLNAAPHSTSGVHHEWYQPRVKVGDQFEKAGAATVTFIPGNSDGDVG